jgi:DNA-directed RNA polymerase subunit alpha
MLQILKPKVRWEVDGNLGRAYIEPLERGFGHTLGNSLRRVLLSSLPGAAITSVRIKGVEHEFTTIPGVVEDVIDIILNLKGIRLKIEMDEAELKIDAKGPKEVKAGDIKAPAGVEIVNTEHHIATLDDRAKLEMTMRAEKGRGYVPAQRNKRSGDPIGVLPIDSIFSPIRKVTYRVENTRVGQRTDYDRLILEVESDGTVSPVEATNMASQIIMEHLKLFAEAGEKSLQLVFDEGESKEHALYNTPIEELNLSVRSYNCLKKNGIDTVEQLINQSEKELLKIRNFGHKSMEEVKEKLEKMGISLKKK